MIFIDGLEEEVVAVIATHLNDSNCAKLDEQEIDMIKWGARITESLLEEANRKYDEPNKT